MNVSTKTVASTQKGGFSSRWAICAVAAFFAAASLLVLLPQAHAVTPKKGGGLVLDVQIRPEARFADPLPDVEQDPNEEILGREGCERLVADETPITYVFTFSGNPRDVLVEEDIMFYATPTAGLPAGFECDRDGITHCYSVNDEPYFETELEEVESGTAQTINVDFDELVNEAVEGLSQQDQLTLIESTADCHPDEEEAFDQQYFVRLMLQEVGVGGTTRFAELAIRVDTIRPPAPSEIVDVTATESTLHLIWEQPERLDAERYHAFWSTTDITGMDIEELVDSDAQRKQISLTNDDPDGTTFEGSVGLDGGAADDPDARLFVAVVSRDEAENFSQPTFADAGVEILPVTDFWEGYREAGGSERGGCTSAGGSLPAGVMGALIFAGGMLWRRRRRS